MKRIFLFFVFCGLYLSGCERAYDVHLRSYVSRYYDVEDVYFIGWHNNKILIRTNEGPLSKPNIYIYNVGYDSRHEEDKQLYDELCTKHNDMSYDKNVTVNGSYPGIPHKYFAPDFISLEIESDSDFDDMHAAGSSLSDITMFCTVSPYPYILSGYKDKYDWDKADEKALEIKGMFPYSRKSMMSGKTPRHPIYKTVSSLSQNDMSLLGVGEKYDLAYLEFTHKPTLSQSHTFTITLTADDGRVFTGTVPMEF